ncbi:MAG: serine/threonine protein kinase [Deltaproteobacteria bacterium]|nr:serine/threonine protein kinase [Deltaproteobacteria bacterium]
MAETPFDPAMLDTMSDDEIARTLKLSFQGDFAETIAHNPTSTIEPPRREANDSQGHRQLVWLGEQRAERKISAGLEIDRTIGEGGMGLVRLATQRSLGRKVAVKTLREGTRSEAASLRLLREAWVTGSLEHPNIVPIYDLGLDDDGSPVIVLKRIEGVEWASCIADADVVRSRYGAADLLEHNLKILVQLCNAVSLAHARGVLHRDLKPENVMIGSFGEVYLVDWGIAVSLREDPERRLPLASQAKEMAGTPAYMAPEMMGAVGTLSERTDVYLLGAILHEILVGLPPHQGTFRQIVSSILLSTFVFPERVPKELADIAKKAMARMPEDRYASAEELKQRIEWYLRHRGYLALSLEAQRRLTEMKAAAQSDGADVEVRERLYHLFAEVRFGFRQAMGVSENDDRARLGLREAIETVVGFELARGTPEAAAAALAELEDPPPELVAKVNAAFRERQEHLAKVARLERMHAELDPTIGRRTRLAATAMLGLFWTVGPLLAGRLHRVHPQAPHWTMYAWSLGAVAVVLAIVAWGRESLSKTEVNRRLVAFTLVTFASQMGLQVGCHLLALAMAPTVILHMVVWATLLAVYGVAIDRRFVVPSLLTWAAFFVSCVRPAWCWNLMSLANLSLLVTFLVAWWKPWEDRPRRLAALRRARARRPDSVS